MNHTINTTNYQSNTTYAEPAVIVAKAMVNAHNQEPQDPKTTQKVKNSYVLLVRAMIY